MVEVVVVKASAGLVVAAEKGEETMTPSPLLIHLDVVVAVAPAADEAMCRNATMALSFASLWIWAFPRPGVSALCLQREVT